MKKKLIYNWIFSVIGIIVALSSVFPLIWMAVSGFKAEAEVLEIPFKFLPEKFLVNNYISLFSDATDVQMQGGAQLFPEGVSFVRSIFFTFAVASFSVILSLIINSMAAYAFSRLEFPLKKQLWIYYLIPWFIPAISIYISCFMVSQKLGLINTFFVLTIPGVANVYAIFFFRQFYLNIPSSIEESALLDGASRFKTYIHIFLPLSKTPFIVMGILIFLGYWNAFIWPVLTISDPKLYMINQIISFFKSSYNVQSQMIMASSTIAALPTIALFLVFQRYIMQGIKVAGLK